MGAGVWRMLEIENKQMLQLHNSLRDQCRYAAIA